MANHIAHSFMTIFMLNYCRPMTQEYKGTEAMALNKKGRKIRG